MSKQFLYTKEEVKTTNKINSKHFRSVLK